MPSSSQAKMTTVTTLFTPTVMVLQTTLFLTAWLTIYLLIQLYGPYPVISSLTRYNSRIYSFLSLLLLLLILSPYETLAREAYHLSKIYEYIDIFGVVAAGGHVGLHFGFHHTTTVWLTFVRVLPEGENEGWRWFAAANAAHHVLMYAYFGGWNGELMRRVLVVTGLVQLGLGMVVDAVVAWGRWYGLGGWWRMAVSGALLGGYMVLSLMEMRQREEERAREAKLGTREGGKEKDK
ncbi:hypothetical protein QBC47DRAFT_395664 [Echria macrotheca]|uniref:Uncharacterized protein n=1 Tax=Echria macrotheca TaxID=438768 RepID=A0AAJ0B0S3_9PEZI|nr:hypothetical protein QBC47DRAFT_395664 [Echria macrotheca]